LQAVTRGEIRRLLITFPPGPAKSLVVSVLWPAWEMGIRRDIATGSGVGQKIEEQFKMTGAWRHNRSPRLREPQRHQFEGLLHRKRTW
jgi:hypothetical protein